MAPSFEIGGVTYLSFAEASRRAAVSSETVRRWVRKKEIPTSFVKGRQVIAEGDLTKFLTPQALEPGVLLPGLVRQESA